MDEYQLSWMPKSGGRFPKSVRMSFSRHQDSTDESTEIMKAWKAGMIAAGFEGVSLCRIVESQLELEV